MGDHARLPYTHPQSLAATGRGSRHAKPRMGPKLNQQLGGLAVRVMLNDSAPLDRPYFANDHTIRVSKCSDCAAALESGSSLRDTDGIVSGDQKAAHLETGAADTGAHRGDRDA